MPTLLPFSTSLPHTRQSTPSLPTRSASTAHPHSYQSGMTLIELMVAMAIIGIVMATGVPTVNAMIQRYQTVADIQSLQMAIYLTRSSAILSKSPTVLCPLVKNKCQRQWNNELTSFHDINRNQTLDPGESIITTVASADPTLILRQYPKKAFRFNSRGFASFNNGSFSYCRTHSETRQTGAAFIVSRLGRIRKGLDADEDGLPETANGKNVICPQS